LSGGQASRARRTITGSGAFLAWLAERGVPLRECRQADLDEWASEGPASGRQARAFLIWSMRTGQMPALALRVHAPGAATAAPMPQRARIAALRRLATDAGLPLRSRVAGSIMLLYAQPVSRIVRLTVGDVATRDGLTTLNLGDPPSHVPEPLAGLLLEYLAQRPNMTTATNPDSRWLFPGRRAGQPLHPSTMYGALDRIGVPALRGRSAAIRQLVLQMPPPVVAQALGYHQVSITRIAAQAGSPWSGYAAGDHSKPTPSP